MKIPDIKKKALTAAFILLSAVLAAGCGGGGGRGGDNIPPEVTITSPAYNAEISDIDFNSQTFKISISYSDSQNEMNFDTLAVTLKMDSGSATSIKSYFQETSSNLIESSNLYQFTQTMFDVQTNDQDHTMTVAVSIRDREGNQGQASTVFTVSPTVGGDGDTTPPPVPGGREAGADAAH